MSLLGELQLGDLLRDPKIREEHLSAAERLREEATQLAGNSLDDGFSSLLPIQKHVLKGGRGNPRDDPFYFIPPDVRITLTDRALFRMPSLLTDNDTGVLDGADLLPPMKNPAPRLVREW